jgi:methylated-DNA-[protein]-cysteine S-methyltransferase
MISLPMNTPSPAYVSTFPTPLGDFSVAVNETGAITATAFGGPEALEKRAARCRVIRDPARGQAARGQIEEYFRGGRRGFTLRLAPAGSPFQRRVWQALQEIPYGETKSYGEIARKLGSSARAVGRANATNPICLIVPCHRVIGADGTLTGFAFGTDLKRRLLAHEGAAATP